MNNSSIENYFLLPGYIFFSEEPYLIQTVLGSCVSICIWDELRQCGGINHYIFGRSSKGKIGARYGDKAIPYLLKLMLDSGSLKQNMKAHIIGGGKNPNLKSLIGDENVEVAEEILKKYDIEIFTRDTGGFTGRKLIFNNQSGELLVYKGINVRRDDWYH